jgi:hypothetical protein
MLAAVEAYFLAALTPAQPDQVSRVAGPSVGPSDAGKELIEVWAQQLTLPLADDEVEAGRSGAFFTTVQQWRGDGTTKDFALPDSAQGQVVEVESPPGRAARLGDDYALDGRTLRFFRAPPAADPAVVAHLRGDPARGFVEKRSCTIALKTYVWSKSAARTDELLRSTLASLLAATVDRVTLSAAMPADSGARLRLLEPLALVTAIGRDATAIRDVSYVRGAIDLVLRGDLEITVVVGAPLPTGIIRDVRPPGA